MSRTRHALWILSFVLFLVVNAPGAHAQQLSPEYCVANTVLPWGYQAWQSQRTWMGIAVSPQNPAQSVYLEVLQGNSFADTTAYSPPVVSTYSNGTNFLLKDFATASDQWTLAKAWNPGLGNLGHTVEWDPGQGALVAGTAPTYNYGGLAGGCGMIRVFKVALTAGETYHFHLTSTQTNDDVRMGLFWSGSLPDGWVTRSDALFERPADPSGSTAYESFTATHTGNHALVVFVNDLTAAGGQYTVSFEPYTAPPNQPDLVVTSILPVTATQGTVVTATIQVANQGTADAAACVTEVTLDGSVTCATITTPALAAGTSTSIQCVLGTPALGAHTIGATVDPTNVVNEADETNNFHSNTLNILSPSLPDLVITRVMPDTAVPNQPVWVSVVVYNNGSLDAPACTTLYSVDNGAVTVSIATPAIPAGGNTIVSDFLPALSEGTHAVVATVDNGNVVTEANESNNSLAHTIVAQGPNLVIDSISPTTVYGNAAPNFQIVVKNTGTVDTGDTYTRLQVDGADECTSIATGPVPAGGTLTVTCPGSTLTPGTHTVTAIADVSRRELESDETDNTLTVTVEMIPTSTVVYADGSGYYATIQEAIDAMPAGGEILLVGGTVYSGPGNRDLDFGGKDLSIVAAFGGGATIDCGGDPAQAHRAFNFHSGETNAARVQGLIIINGWYEYGAGGGILITDAEPTIQDCLIRNCTADVGGALAFSSSASYYHPQIVGCTIVGNHGNTLAAAVYLEKNSAPVFTRCLITGNSSYYGPVSCDPYLGTPQPVFTCSDIWGNNGGDWTDCISGQLGVDNNFSQDPLFCDPANNVYTLASNSPCSSTVNGTCSRIGAYDAACGPLGGTIRHVKADGSGEYLTIQHAINNSVDGDIIELADGVYVGTGNTDVNTLGLKIVIRSASGDSSACRIDAQNAHRGFVFDHGETPETTIQGIGVVNGSNANGAAIYCQGSSPTLLNLYLSGNNASGDGGGLYCTGYASPVVENCFFENNTAVDDGGGLYAYNWSSPTVRNCRFVGNTAVDRGGGAVFSVNSFPVVENCTFQSNQAVNGGGLIFVYAYGPVTNCVFQSNTGDYGGAVQCYGNAHADFIDCTMNDNAAAQGACVYMRANSSPTFQSCILAFGRNGAAFDRYAADCNPVLSCTDVHGNALGDWGPIISSQLGVNGNFNADPLFCDRVGGNLTLRGDSPCAAVNNVGCGQVGALGVGCSGKWLVRPDGTGDFATIQEAIDAAVAGETVVLADGVFTGTGNRDIDFRGKEITVRSQSGDSTQCIIDCQASATDSHRGFVMISGETNNSVLERVTIRNAYRTYGAAMRIDNASPVIRGVIFSGCQGGNGGGILMGNGAAPIIEDCIFENNVVSDAGGGIYVNASFPQISRCVFRGNSATWGGGAVYHQHAAPNFADCHFENNSSEHWGGAVHNRYSESAPHFNNCLFTGNTAPQGGAVYGRDGSYPSFTACTFSGNSSADGSAFHLRSASGVSIIRSILAFAPEGAALTSDGTATVQIYCSDVYGNAGGDWIGDLGGQLGSNNNFSLNPSFCDQYAGDFTLASNSPCLPVHNPCNLQVGAFGQGCVATEVPETPRRVPSELVLEPNVPNPFNPRTTIFFSVPDEGDVKVSIYGIDGRRITTLLTGVVGPGRHQVVWTGTDDQGRQVASGVYLVRVEAKGESRVRKLALVR